LNFSAVQLMMMLLILY